MIRGLRTHAGGFTIVELMVVMSVTIALLGSALLVFQGRVPRTQFSSAINDLSTQLTELSNQVSTGYYSNRSTLTCTPDGVGGFDIEDSGTNSLGRNSDCIYIGQVVHLGSASGGCTSSPPNEKCSTVDVYTVYGSRLQSGGGLVSTLSEAQPKITEVNKTSFQLGYGTHIVNAKVDDQRIGGIAYLQSFGGNRDAGSTVPTGASQVNAVPLVGVNIGQPQGEFMIALNESTAPAGIYAPANPSNGIKICLKSGGTNQYAIVWVATGGVVNSSRVEILEPSEWSVECA